MSDCDLITRVARRIAEVRGAVKLTQREMAERLDIAVRNYQRIEYGEHSLTLRMVETIASALGVGATDLLEPPAPASMRTNKGRPPEVVTIAITSADTDPSLEGAHSHKR